MTPEIVATLAAAVGMFIALSGLIVSLFLSLCSDMQRMHSELRGDIQAVDRKVDDLGERVTQLGERVARIEGKLEFLKDFIARRNDLPPRSG